MKLSNKELADKLDSLKEVRFGPGLLDVVPIKILKEAAKRLRESDEMEQLIYRGAINDAREILITAGNEELSNGNPKIARKLGECSRSLSMRIKKSEMPK